MKLTGKIMLVEPAMYNGVQRTFETKDGKRMEVWNVHYELAARDSNAKYRDTMMADYIREQKDGQAKPFAELEGSDKVVVATVVFEIEHYQDRHYNRVRMTGVTIKAE